MHFMKQAAVLLSALMMAAALPMLSAAAADEEFDGKSADGKFGYNLRDEGGISVYCTDPQIETAEVPSEIDGYAVTALKEGCFSKSPLITEVTLPEGLLVIGEGAFSSCEKLTGLTIPESVTTIGTNAFYGCMGLKEITIPAAVTEIQSYAFDTTEGMTAFHVAEGNPAYSSHDGVLYDKNAVTLIKYPEAKPDASYTVAGTCKTIEDWAFVGAQHLTEIDLGKVDTIGEDAFYYCVALKSVEIPEGVQELVGAAFCYCVALEDVKFPSTLQSIGENCFYSCTSLQEVVLPKGLKRIDAYAFFHCTSLKSINIPSSVENISGYCIGYFYDDSAEGSAVQKDLTVKVAKRTPGYTYASSNDLTVKTVSDVSLYHILIAVTVVLIIVLLAAIVIVLKKQRK